MLSFISSLFTYVSPSSLKDPFPMSSEEEPKHTFQRTPSLPAAGKFEDMNERSSEVFDLESHTWTGLQLNMQNILHPKFVTAHTLALGKKENIDPYTEKKDDERSMYAFTSYLKTDHMTLNGRWSTGGITRANYNYERGPLSFSFQGQFSEDEKKTGWEADATISVADMCLQGKLQGPAFGVSYTQPIWNNYSMGCEMLWSPLNGASRLKWLGKKDNKTSNSTTVVGISTGIGPDQLSINYTRGVLKQLEITTALDISHSEKDRQWSSVYKLGYNLKHSEQSTTKGMVDSTYKVACITEEPLNDAVMLQLSAKIDFLKNVYDFGMGIMLSS